MPKIFEKLPQFDISTKAGASIYESEIEAALSKIRFLISYAITSVNKKIACSNTDQKILFFTNFAGMAFGVLRAWNQEQNLKSFKNIKNKLTWKISFISKNPLSDTHKKTLEELDKISEQVYYESWGNHVQGFAQASYGYGYWGRFTKTESSKVNCGYEDFDSALEQYSEVVKDGFRSLNPIMAEFVATELNTKIKENLHCLISSNSGNRAATELSSYIDVYTNLLADNSDDQN